MIRGMAMLVLSVASGFAPNVPLGTAAAMGLAAVAGMTATRLHDAAERLAANGDPAGAASVRVARACDDGAVALCLLAILYAVVRL